MRAPLGDPRPTGRTCSQLLVNFGGHIAAHDTDLWLPPSCVPCSLLRISPSLAPCPHCPLPAVSAPPGAPQQCPAKPHPVRQSRAGGKLAATCRVSPWICGPESPRAGAEWSCRTSPSVSSPGPKWAAHPFPNHPALAGDSASFFMEEREAADPGLPLVPPFACDPAAPALPASPAHWGPSPSPPTA